MKKIHGLKLGNPARVPKKKFIAIFDGYIFPSSIIKKLVLDSGLDPGSGFGSGSGFRTKPGFGGGVGGSDQDSIIMDPNPPHTRYCIRRRDEASPYVPFP